ncbi:MAG TPA: alpha/beta hydrolase [Caulobacteraceae bacterium]
MAEPAPLIATPAAPIPTGGEAQWFIGAGGARLRAALFPPAAPPRGSVVVSPGRTEPIEKYFETAENLTSRGFTVLIHDWRGQGLSHRLLADRLAGHAAGYGDFLTDYRALLGTFEPRLPRPWVALGHSMGGCLTLLALAKGEDRFCGAILSAPMLGLSTGALPRLVGRTLAKVQAATGRGGAPIQGRGGVQAPTPFEANVLTHDHRRYERNEAQVAACPDLALGSPTWGWLDFAFSAIAVLESGAGTPRVAIPVTILAAGEEKLVDNAGMRRISARLPAGRFVEIPGAFHEILQETDETRAVFWREFDALAARAGVAEPGAP